MTLQICLQVFPEKRQYVCQHPRILAPIRIISHSIELLSFVLDPIFIQQMGESLICIYVIIDRIISWPVHLQCTQGCQKRQVLGYKFRYEETRSQCRNNPVVHEKSPYRQLRLQFR
jgi:hypothetical protein